MSINTQTYIDVVKQLDHTTRSLQEDSRVKIISVIGTPANGAKKIHTLAQTLLNSPDSTEKNIGTRLNNISKLNHSRKVASVAKTIALIALGILLGAIATIATLGAIHLLTLPMALVAGFSSLILAEGAHLSYLYAKRLSSQYHEALVKEITWAQNELQKKTPSLFSETLPEELSNRLKKKHGTSTLNPVRLIETHGPVGVDVTIYPLADYYEVMSKKNKLPEHVLRTPDDDNMVSPSDKLEHYKVVPQQTLADKILEETIAYDLEGPALKTETSTLLKRTSSVNSETSSERSFASLSSRSSGGATSSPPSPGQKNDKELPFKGAEQSAYAFQYYNNEEETLSF